MLPNWAPQLPSVVTGALAEADAVALGLPSTGSPEAEATVGGALEAMGEGEAVPVQPLWHMFAGAQ